MEKDLRVLRQNNRVMIYDKFGQGSIGMSVDGAEHVLEELKKELE